jgi:hypothetical protein
MATKQQGVSPRGCARRPGSRLNHLAPLPLHNMISAAPAHHAGPNPQGATVGGRHPRWDPPYRPCGHRAAIFPELRIGEGFCLTMHLHTTYPSFCRASVVRGAQGEASSAGEMPGKAILAAGGARGTLAIARNLEAPRDKGVGGGARCAIRSS